MRNFKALVATSLACVLDVGVVYGGDCSLGGGFLACFKYGDSKDVVNPGLTQHQSQDNWTSYKKSLSSASIFGSLGDLNGQYVPKNGKNFLGIANSRSTLLLDDVRAQLGLKFPFSVGIYVDGQSEDTLQFRSTDGLTVGNLVVTGSSDTVNNKTETRVVHLLLMGNGMVSHYDIANKNQDYKRSFSSIVRSTEVPLAFFGGVWNDSGMKVDAEFKGGARMMGNIYVGGHGSKNSFLFDGKETMSSFLGMDFWRNYHSFSVVFHGGVFAENGGENKINVKEGGLVAEALGGEAYGIEAKNGGKNSLIFGGGYSRPQSLFATELTSSSIGWDWGAENDILFQNGMSTGNLITLGGAFANGGKNTIWTTGKTRANLEVEDLMSASQGGVNAVALNGGAIIGRMALVNPNSHQYKIGIVATNGGSNVIRLKDTSGGKEEVLKEWASYYGVNLFDLQRTLATPGFYAGGNGKNDVDVDGDLVLLYHGGFGGKIVATEGGKNDIAVNGGFLTVGYDSSNDILLNRTHNMKAEYKINLGASHSSIIVYGGHSQSENNIQIRNVGADNSGKKGGLGGGNRDLLLGNIFAYGGTNNVGLYGSDNRRVEISNIVAENGGKGIDGVNNVSVCGGSSVVLQKIVTESGGENRIWISRGIKQSQISNLNLTYYFGGKTLLYFGRFFSGYISDGLSSMLQSLSGKQTLSMSVMNGPSYDVLIKSGAFWGDIKYDTPVGTSTSANIPTHYFLNNDTIFAGTINMSPNNGNALTNGNLSLQSGSKFILKNQGTTSFGTLILSNSTSPNSDVLKDTIKLHGTALDLATNGESYSNFNRGSQGKTLEVGTLAINAGDNSADSSNTHNPLLRLFVGGVGGGQADNLKVGKFVSKSPSNGALPNNQSIKYKIPSEINTGGKKTFEEKNVTNFGKTLDAQIFLPTSLIGQDFTSKNVVILSVGEGGGELELNSRVAQTGFTNYWVEIQKQEIEKTAQEANGVSSGNGVNSQVATSSAVLSSSTPSTTSPSSSTSQDTPKSHQWVLGKTIKASISEDSIRLADTILTHNHSAWTLAINSLNKRMGELRDNPYSQGVWARVFGGEQTSNHGSSNINSGYVTLQGGYDYAFTLNTPWGQAKNYLGVALSYNLMTSKSEEFMGSGVINDLYAYNAISHGVEVGIYDTFIYDWGLYFDTIIKFGYITTGFDGINAHSSQANVSNYHTTFGAEVGYQFRLGKNQEWSVTPQVELIYGYLSQSDAKQYYDGQTLHSTLEGVSTLRARVGSDFAYRFKKWGNFYDLRLGISYEGDYANANASYGVVGAGYLDKVSKDSLISTDHRIVLNVGTNMQVHDQVRLYVDLESSFCGKVNTKYQINLGARYSFGEKKLSTAPKERMNLPVRVEGE